MKTISWTLFLLLLVLVGCTNKEENVKLLQGRTWQLKTMSFEGKTVQIPEKSPDLQFSDSSAFYGFAGCTSRWRSRPTTTALISDISKSPKHEITLS